MSLQAWTMMRDPIPIGSVCITDTILDGCCHVIDPTNDPHTADCDR